MFEGFRVLGFRVSSCEVWTTIQRPIQIASQSGSDQRGFPGVLIIRISRLHGVIGGSPIFGQEHMLSDL